ncbi:hypothetical protein CDAR_109281 [Caerostris darwini]|uniref:Uncharacterized protein n=1 Tax=Caerostris darwini TaxID=1538125 RepID=A0AAV4TTY6_9ARAC|nr:hypothetical protein CDAR_109281 [Caerostris darwini]
MIDPLSENVKGPPFTRFITDPAKWHRMIRHLSRGSGRESGRLTAPLRRRCDGPSQGLAEGTLEKLGPCVCHLRFAEE